MNDLKLSYDSSRRDPVRVSLPLSKSMAARALVISAWQGVRPADAPRMPVCTDTVELSHAVDALLDVAPVPADLAAHTGEKPASAVSRLVADLGLGGTSLRFFTALAASVPGLDSEISCAEALARRPIRPLCDALADAGADIGYARQPWHAPLSVKGRHMKGGAVTMPGDISSQYASAMMMCAPYWQEGLSLLLTGDTTVSVPYLRMTADMMQEAGALVSVSPGFIRVFPTPYQWRLPEDAVEPDWSAASYFYALSLLLPEREVEFDRLTPPAVSKQGDCGCAEIFSRFGIDTECRNNGSAVLRCDVAKRDAVAEASACGQPMELYLSDMPDLVPAIAVALCLTGIRFRMTGIGHLRHKECDRISAVTAELLKLGYRLDEGADTMSWLGERTASVGVTDGNGVISGESEGDTSRPDCGIRISTYGDHRMAMAFAPAAIRFPGLVIENPAVTSKSFPTYFPLLSSAGFESAGFASAGFASGCPDR